MMCFVIGWCAKHRVFLIAMFALLAIGADAARRRLNIAEPVAYHVAQKRLREQGLQGI